MSAILGTAGHIDHGKTALVRALTGIDTDRLKEERERGISIDLGFAYFDADDGTRAGVVDVPGHERFIRNMLAGAHGMDLVLLVVAADDGVMPQTEEHVDILHLLNVRHGIVAMTKVDLVDASRRVAVREEIDILLSGTTLEGSPVYDVSTVSGEGIAQLRVALADQLQRSGRPESGGCFRLPIDRAFIMHGHGLVVTGTATAGTITADAPVRLLPAGTEARVRAIQVHGQPTRQGRHGQRLALNLAGIERDVVSRGDVVCDPELERTTDRLDAWVELRPAAGQPLRNHSQVRLYLGTAEVMARVIWLDGRGALSPREQAYTQLVLREPIAAFGGDRFILRDQTARTTIGGGIVLHPFAPRATRGRQARVEKLAAVDHAVTDAERLDALLALEGTFAIAPEHLAAVANLRSSTVRSLLAGREGLLPLPDAAHIEAYATKEKWEGLRAAIAAALSAYHSENPRQTGMEMESLRSQIAPDLTTKVFRAVIAHLERAGELIRDESLLRRRDHQVALGPGETELATKLVRILTEAKYTPPDIKQIEREIGAQTGDEFRDVLSHLERDGRIVKVSPDLYFAASAVSATQELVMQYATEHGHIDAATLRDLIGGSRKFSIALLTYFDRLGFTMRIGDIRKVRKR